MITLIRHRFAWIVTAFLVSLLCAALITPPLISAFIFLTLLSAEELLAQVNPYPALRRAILLLALALILPAYPGFDWLYAFLSFTVLCLAGKDSDQRVWGLALVFILTMWLSFTDPALALFAAVLACHCYLPRKDWNVLWFGFAVLPALTATLLYLDGKSMWGAIPLERLHWPVLLSGPSLTEPLSHILILATGVYCLLPGVTGRRLMSPLFYFLVLVTVFSPLKVHHGAVEFVSLTILLSASLTAGTLEHLRSQGAANRFILFLVILFLCLPYAVRLGW